MTLKWDHCLKLDKGVEQFSHSYLLQYIWSDTYKVSETKSPEAESVNSFKICDSDDEY